MIRLKTGYANDPADELFHLGTKVGKNLPTIPNLAGVVPSPADILAAANALETAMQIVGPSRAVQVAAAKKILADLLGNLAKNAPQMKDVTDADLKNIGLPEDKTPVRSKEKAGLVLDLRLRHSDMPGEIIGTCKKPEGNIRILKVQWAEDTNGPWHDAEDETNSRAIKISGLPRGKDIWVRVCAVNTVGAGPWSDPATIMVT